MHTPIGQQLARQLREYFFGPSFTGTYMQELLEDLRLEQAQMTIGEHNTILALVYHINYYIAGVLVVLRGGELTIKDRYSYDHPAVETEQEWKALVDRSYRDAEAFAKMLEQIKDQDFYEPFVDEKYGSYLRNMVGLLEHSHYHLGQIALLKKLILAQDK